MATEIFTASYDGAGISNIADGISPSIPLAPGTITGVRVKLNSGNTTGAAVFNFAKNGTEQFTTELTIPNGDDEIDATGLSITCTNDDVFTFNLNGPFPTSLPDPPYSYFITVDLGTSGDAMAIAAAIHAATGKTTPVDADELGIVDSAASNVLKKLTWANLKATLKTYFDTLYQPLAANLTALAGLTSASNKIPYFTGSGTAGLLTLDTDATLAAASNSNISPQGALKSYIDNAVAGLSWKKAVRVATTANGTLASAFENGDTVDGVTLATGDRILIKDQSTASENGIYTVNASGAPTRATDADSGAELINATVFVSEGTANADTQWTCTNNATITVGSTNLVFAQITSGGGTYTADETTLHLSGSQFQIKASGVGSTELANSGVTLAKLANIADQTILGNNTGGAVAPVALTASQIRTLLALVIGTNVQAWDADLDTWATKTPPSGAAVGTTDTQTLTNKRITARIGTTASSSTPTPDADANDEYTVTALAANATFAAPSGTPTDGQSLIIRIKDNGTARTLAWNAIYRDIGITLPTATTISKTLYLGMVYNSADSKWDVLGVCQEA